MRKWVVILIVMGCVGAAGLLVYGRNGSTPQEAQGASGASAAGGRGGRGGQMRPPMPVEFATVKRAPVADQILVVGNLIGAATVQAVPKVNGRLAAVHVQLGDRVRQGQAIAKVEDREIQEQVRQAEASYEVARATIRQREADLTLAKTNLDRNRSLLERQLLPRQTFDDTDARHQAALAQLDLAKAQFAQAKSRLDELRINLANTVIASPVEGFIGKRFLDPGASVSPNQPVASVVDIRVVRMVANLVEKDFRRVTAGTPAQVEVDAFPGEKFAGRVSRVAPVFDPATRTAEMEIEVPNPGYRLKPGMYARVQLTVDTRPNALIVPSNAVVDFDGKRGVFVAAPREGEPQRQDGPAVMTARFRPVQTGISDGTQVEIIAGLNDGVQVITTGATALRDGDRIVPASEGQTEGGRGRGRGNGQGARGPRAGS
jgi:membrane fusion protein (multidrug efflux system)